MLVGSSKKIIFFSIQNKNAVVAILSFSFFFIDSKDIHATIPVFMA